MDHSVGGERADWQQQCKGQGRGTWGVPAILRGTAEAPNVGTVTTGDSFSEALKAE